MGKAFLGGENFAGLFNRISVMSLYTQVNVKVNIS